MPSEKSAFLIVLNPLCSFNHPLILSLSHLPPQQLNLSSTAATVPGIPTNLMAIEQTNISLFITWTIPDFDGGSPLTDFRVRITNQRTFVIETRFTDRVVNEYNITDLDPFTTYTIAVAAINTNGRGDPAIIEADTLSESM